MELTILIPFKRGFSVVIKLCQPKIVGNPADATPKAVNPFEASAFKFGRYRLLYGLCLMMPSLLSITSGSTYLGSGENDSKIRKRTSGCTAPVPYVSDTICFVKLNVESFWLM